MLTSLLLTQLDEAFPLPTLAGLAGVVVGVAVLVQDAVAVLFLKGVVFAVVLRFAGEGALGQRGDHLGIDKVAPAGPLTVADSLLATTKDKLGSLSVLYRVTRHLESFMFCSVGQYC